MKNIIVGVITVFILFLSVSTLFKGGAYQGGEGTNVFKNTKAFEQKEVEAQKQTREDETKLKALKDKAGSVSSFKVSNEYKSKCSSCHGVNGQGILGPNLVALSQDEVYKALMDYKSGRRENAVMKGLLLNIDNATLKTLSEEIGAFKTQVAQ